MTLILKNQDPGSSYISHFVSGMGTKLEPTFHLPPPNANFLTLNDLSQFHSFAMTGLHNFQEALNKTLHKSDIDSIRNTMQTHEHLFNLQVKELHRLYSVQKMLMEELRKEAKQNTSWTPMVFNLQTLRDDPSCRERSGSCSGDNMRISRGFDLERPADDVSTGVSAVDEDRAGPSTPIAGKNNKTTGDGGEEDSDIELTLSIGGSLSKKRSLISYPLPIKKDREMDSSVSFKSERGEECSDPTTPMSSSSATCDQQETKRPHWLFQSLKLK